MFEHGFPSHWSTIKKLIWLKGAGIIGGASAVWKTVTGTLIHITDALASPVRELSVAIEPQQSGSGDPSPTNIRPITGATGCGINCAGANLYDNTYEKTGYLQANGDRKTSSSWAITYYIEVSTGNYVAKGLSVSGSGTYICIYDSAQTFIRSVEITPNADIYFQIANGEKYIRMSVRIGSSEYETAQLLKYDIHTISWQSEAGTVYGGTLTVNEDGSADLSVTMLISKISSFSWSYYASGPYFRTATVSNMPRGYNNVVSSLLCSAYKTVAPNNLQAKSINIATNYRIVIVDADFGSDVSAFLSAMGNETICYPIVEPITYHFDNVAQISTLIGENNIWADVNGEITLTYLAQAE